MCAFLAGVCVAIARLVSASEWMGAQTMSSHGSGAGGGGALSQQGTVCGLALSDVEGQLHGVNLDDLLRTTGSAAAAAGKKTVDEVWRDIQGTSGGGCLLPAAAQMTLEDFLSRADTGSGCVGARWAQQQYHPPPEPAPAPPGQHHHVGRPVARPLSVGTGPVLDSLYHDGAAAGRKRAAEGGAAEKTVERRKKRMIKNRESAARSRARKQAYTNELENKISRLEEENERLRRHKAFEPVMQYVPQLEPNNQLRRINSANF